MKAKRILLLAICAICLVGFNLNAQENTTYFYRAIVTTSPEEGRTPFAYLPVYMSCAEAPDEIIAVRMTDRAGIASFYGIPIDIYKDYIFTLPLKDGEVRYIRTGFKEEPRFKSGNSDSFIWLDASTQWATVVEKTPGKDVGKLNSLEWLQKEFPDIGLDGTTFFDKKSEGTLLFSINGFVGDGVDMNKLLKLLKKLPAEYVESAELSLLSGPNDYFAGAIDMTLPGQGEPKPAWEGTHSIPLYEE